MQEKASHTKRNFTNKMHFAQQKSRSVRTAFFVGVKESLQFCLFES